MQKILFSITHFLSAISSGSKLVLMVVLLGALASWLTFWNYSQHVFSSSHAEVVSASGIVEAFFPIQKLDKIGPYQQACVSFKKKNRVFKATVLSVGSINSTSANSTICSSFLVKLQLLEELKKDKCLPILQLGTPCDVTIDTTVPLDEK